MIICYLRGGLGNQILQYLVSSYYAKKLKLNVVFSGVMMLKFFQSRLGWSIRALHFKKLISSKYSFYSFIVFVFIAVAKAFRREKYLSFDGARFQTLPFSRDIIIDGYIQSVKILDSISLDLWRNVFFILSGSSSDYIVDTGIVSVHIRKGDYLSYSDIYHSLDVTYFLDAIKHILDMTNDIRQVKLYTDDLPWVFQNFLPVLLPFIKSRGVALAIDDSCEVEAFCSMSCSSHLVMSNSTFSLCSAYIIRAFGGTGCIVQPPFWFNNKANAFLDSVTLV